jgi:N-methylhydantoinase B/oxoprolinase/acetone carboxylase alpha subunit
MRVPPGSRVVLETPGGAGFGDPAMRAAPALAEDIRQGYVSAARATIAYGVDAAVE